MTAAVNLLLRKKGLEPVDGDEAKELQASLAAVLNKHWSVGGKYAEEITLLVNVVTLAFPKAYAYYVIIPERKRRAREQAIAAGKQPLAQRPAAPAAPGAPARAAVPARPLQPARDPSSPPPPGDVSGLEPRIPMGLRIVGDAPALDQLTAAEDHAS